MIKVKIPKVCLNEQRYILNILLNEFLGLSFQVETHDCATIEITHSSFDEKLTLDSSFFQLANEGWLAPESMPNLPLIQWKPENDGIDVDLISKEIPVLYGKSGIVKRDKHWHLNVDIFGSAFFMLSRYEELVTLDRDSHNRFPAWASTADKAGFLDRPIVNEYLEIFWGCISLLWPFLQRKKQSSENFITCDVDWPFNPAYYFFKSMIKVTAQKIIKEYALISAVKILSKFCLNKLGVKIKDEFRENLSWMMDVNEQAGNKIAFYFITYNTSPLDTVENFDSLKMRLLFKEISSRGHEIGIHPGYETFNNSVNFDKTVKKLKRILIEEGVQQEKIGGRQHYLCWSPVQTALLWEKHQLEYDSTLAFADKSGFRCGVCYEFTMYDTLNRKPFKLKQRPLLVMECTVIASRYEGLGYSEESLARFNLFKKRAKMFNGTFTLLWHNSYFEHKKDKEFYTELIQ